mmetsp:Transcript_56575/g.99424  ORF Transcript_56575/g.99424 Transcript_56575/m.99424 type:complete len:244 (-) Transcript_56575:200-931(-)|eukprot:CAMPEP_0184988276 /NCGR_PEP_ID=MMETSP1098-20130426/23761_1 /TAXON_ID=89044 /ORGANISM="Spumella elongata, Strain CCAP 955/1" /LENGTH=243 /DNA_ID=CAMNT_0027512989 /DNA_START=169 /DNA_END=900 /DNA_ORIENTATION=+
MSVEEVVDHVVLRANVMFNAAQGWYDHQKSRRNELALQAANDLYGKESELIRLIHNPQLLIQRLEELRNHYEHWEDKFRGWGGHDHEYAMQVHRESKEIVREALRGLHALNRNLELVHRSVNLVLAFSGSGGSAGNHKVTMRVKEGFSSHNTTRSSHDWSVSASASGSYLGCNFEANTNYKGNLFQETITKTSAEREMEETVYVDFSKPCYLYYPQVQLQSSNGEIATFSSRALIQSDKPMTA